jgi:hypothetical protein
MFHRLQEETARVEEHLLGGPFNKAIVECFINNDASASTFENFLNPLQKLLRLSPPVASTLAQEALFQGTAQKLSTKKAVVRLNLLRIISSICDANEEQGGASLIETFHLYEAVERLAESDPAILVREMASDLIKSCDYSRHSYEKATRGIRPGTRRSSSASVTPPGQTLLSSRGLVSSGTPSHIRTAQGKGYFDNGTSNSGSGRYDSTRILSRRPSASTLSPSTSSYRPASRDSTSSDRTNGLANNTAASSSVAPPNTRWESSTPGSGKSRLPRTSGTRLTRLSLATRKEENVTPTHTPGQRTGSALNPARRRRVTSSGASSGLGQR